MMSERIPAGLAQALGVTGTRPVILGEYPYYRADPARWQENLTALAVMGVDVITCYLPWRFHEVAGTSGFSWDFGGAQDPQRDVRAFLDSVTAAGLYAILKPGPFIHAEVQLGGLPDRVCDSTTFPQVADADGRPAMTQRRPLPSYFSASFRPAVRDWLAAVVNDVVTPHLYPHGPVIGLQLGNEGLYSDAALPITAHDFSTVARDAFDAHLQERGLEKLRAPARTDPTAWTTGLRHEWARWSGRALADVLGDLARQLPGGVPHLTNLPLAAPGQPGALAGWLSRLLAVRDRVAATTGYTSWVGDVATDRRALGAHLTQVRLARADNVETNWGFTWDDASYAEPRTPLFHSLLALGLGSTSVSVYTACATRHWGDAIDLDAAALREDGIDPALYAPPYCPGAPLDETGGATPNATALRMLRDFLHWHGTDLGLARFAPDLVVYVAESLAAEEAWPAEAGGGLLDQVQLLVADLLLNYGCQADVTYEPEGVQASDTMPMLVVGDPQDLTLAGLLSKRAANGQRTVLLTPTPVPAGRLPAAVPLVTGKVEADTLMDLLEMPRPVTTPDAGAGFALCHRNRQDDRFALFSFNPGSVAATVERTFAGNRIRVVLAPGGCCALVGARGEVTGYLYGAGAPTAPIGDDEPVLTGGRLSASAAQARDVVARRLDYSWQIRRYGDLGEPTEVLLAAGARPLAAGNP